MSLGIMAGIVQLVGYLQYHVAMSKTGHKPNTASWFMWGAGGLTELVVYAALVKDHSKEILPAVCAVVVILTFIRVLWKEGIVQLSIKEWSVVGIDAGVVLFWFITKDPIASNILLGSDMILSFIPILIAVRADPDCEDPKPWRTWSIAYLLLTIVVIVNWVNAWELIYPVIYLVLHTTVWLLSKKSTKTAANQK